MTAQHMLFDAKRLNEDELASLLAAHQVNLTPKEVRLLHQEILFRPPTLAECFLWAIQGSEHCSYKSSKKYLRTLPTSAPHVISGAKEDAGIVAVATDQKGARYGIAVSHESHNHPSQIVPFEGAATGIGGNIRDVCCMGAEVIALGDGLRFGSLAEPKTHFIYEGVVQGIGAYGNASGIPNIAGDVFFDDSYNNNCLVTVVTLGIVKETDVIHSFAPPNAVGHVYILVGKATDNSGFQGASFASSSLKAEDEESNKGAVQEPDAFLKRHLLKANYALFERLRTLDLLSKVGFKDLGAGGIACAAVEMAEASSFGAFIDLDQVPVSMENLMPHVVLCSETQERFMWIVPEEHAELVLEHYNKTFDLPSMSHNARAKIVGRVTNDKNFVVSVRGSIIVNAKASDVTKGIVYDRAVTPRKNTAADVFTLPTLTGNDLLCRILAHENVASRRPIIETYDKQVQGRTMIEAGQADAGLIMPFNEPKYPEEIRNTGVALSLDQNPRFNRIDPYWGAVNAVVESARNVVSVGATPVSLSDCLCFGNPEKPEQMWEFAESVRGIADACRGIGARGYSDCALPVISGNVSFYNETNDQPIPASPMIACLGAMNDANKAVTPHFKQAGSVLLLVGQRLDECGGSVYYDLFGQLGTALPKPNLKTIKEELLSVLEAIESELVLACHDISLGGLAVALAKMSFQNNVGCSVEVSSNLPATNCYFSETSGFILEVREKDLNSVSRIFARHSISVLSIGHTTDTARLSIGGFIDISIEEAKIQFENGLKDKLV